MFIWFLLNVGDRSNRKVQGHFTTNQTTLSTAVFNLRHHRRYDNAMYSPSSAVTCLFNVEARCRHRDCNLKFFFQFSELEKMTKSNVFSIRRRMPCEDIIAEEGKKKYSLSCLVQREIYSVKAGTERREGRVFWWIDNSTFYQPSSIATRINAQYGLETNK